jgi:restriction endonuclease S subunit
MGDVLVNSTGEGTIGRAAVADAGCVGTPIDSHVMIVRSRSDGPLLPEFLEAYLRSAGGQAQVEAAKGANTTKQTELGKAKLERFVVPLPSRNEQRVFIASYLEMLDAVGALQAEFARSDAVLKAIRPSALNDAFADLS